MPEDNTPQAPTPQPNNPNPQTPRPPAPNNLPERSQTAQPAMQVRNNSQTHETKQTPQQDKGE